MFAQDNPESHSGQRISEGSRQLASLPQGLPEGTMHVPVQTESEGLGLEHACVQGPIAGEGSPSLRWLGIKDSKLKG